MAVKSAQVGVSTVAGALFSTATFKNEAGNMQDSVPAIIKNLDAGITIYVGGPDVTTVNGYPLLAGQSLPFSFIGNEMTTVWVVAASGSPILAILAGRQ